MFASSSLWRFEGSDLATYFSDFWTHSIYNFELLENHHIPASFLAKTPLKISNVAMNTPYAGIHTCLSPVSEKSEERNNAIENLISTAKKALHMKTPYVVVWPGVIPMLQDAEEASANQADLWEKRHAFSSSYLDRLCRSLHQVNKVVPDAIFCIPPARTLADLPLCDELEWIISDLKNIKIQYWHNPVSCRLLNKAGHVEPEAWLEKYSSQMAGVYLEDMIELEGLYPPGIGEIDFQYLKKNIPHQAMRVLRIDSRIEPEQLWFCYQYLKDQGLL